MKPGNDVWILLRCNGQECVQVLSIPVKDAINLKLDLILALAAKHDTCNHVMYLIDPLTP